MTSGDSSTYQARLPFDLYDFFGYLFPGAVLVAVVGLVAWNSSAMTDVAADSLRLQRFWDSVVGRGGPGLAWWVDAMLLFAAITTVYGVGHAVATASSICFDRIFMKRVRGYPYARLLDLPPRQMMERRLVSSVVAWVFTGVNAWAVAETADILASWETNASVYVIYAAVVAVGSTGIVWLVLRLVERCVPVPDESACRNRLLCLVRVPLHVWNFLLDHVDVEVFPKDFITAYLASYRDTFRTATDDGDDDTNYFWLPYFVAIERYPHIRSAESHFLHLYGFCRNMSMACYVAGAFCAVSAWRDWISAKAVLPIEWLSILLFGVGLLMFVRYYYLYAGYFTKFAMRAFVLATNDPPAGN